MKSLKPLIYYSLIAVMASTLYSCKKDKAQPAVDVIYTVAVDGLNVTFTNETKGATSYKWDFGDGATHQTIEDISLIGDPEKNFLVIMKDGVLYKDTVPVR